VLLFLYISGELKVVVKEKWYRELLFGGKQALDS
jgi:hypothetical protein